MAMPGNHPKSRPASSAMLEGGQSEEKAALQPTPAVVLDKQTGRAIYIVNTDGKAHGALKNDSPPLGRRSHAMAASHNRLGSLSKGQLLSKRSGLVNVHIREFDFNLPRPVADERRRLASRQGVHLEELIQEGDELFSEKMAAPQTPVARPRGAGRRTCSQPISIAPASSLVLRTPSPEKSLTKVKSGTSLLKSRTRDSMGLFSHQEDKLISGLKSHLNLDNKKAVIEYLERLNEPDGDSADETRVLSFSGSSSPVGSSSDASLPRSFTAMSSPMADELVYMLRTSRFSSIFDFTNSSSPICRAIESQWNKAPHKLSVWENERVQAHCLRLLRTSYDIPPSDDEVCFLLQSYLMSYETAFQGLFPKTCEALKLTPPIWQEDVVDALQNEEDFLCVYGGAANPFTRTIELFQEIENVLSGEVIDSETINQRQYTQYANRYLNVGKSAKAFWQRLPTPETDAEGEVSLLACLREDVRKLESQLSHSANVIHQFRKNDFRSPANWHQCIDVMTGTVLKHLQATSGDLEFADACQKLTGWKSEQVYPVNGIAQFIEELHEREKALREMFNIDISTFNSLREMVLSEQKPRVRRKELSYLFERQYYPVQVTHQPGACITFGLDEMGVEDVVVDTHKESEKQDALGLNGKLFPSCVRNAGRAVNLAVTKVSMGEEIVMQEIRVAVPFAYAVAGKREQKSVTRQWFKDILSACGLTFFRESMLKNFRPEGLSAGETVPMPVFYNCLLSPDNLRPKFRQIPAVDDEKRWCHKMDKCIDELNTEDLALTLFRKDGDEGTVRVRPDIFMFVCPCNQLAYSGALQFAKAWENADQYNEKCFLRLFGTLDPSEMIAENSYVQKFLDRNPDLDLVVEKELHELCSLLRCMFHHKLHRELGDLPFNFPVCISELGRILGMANVSGCKSAKDRTGNFERSNIEMALRLNLTRKALNSRLAGEGGQHPAAIRFSSETVVPVVDRRMTSEDFYNHAMLLLCSDQLEVTMDNLGKPGFKIPDYMLGFLKDLYPTVDAYLAAKKAAASTKTTLFKLSSKSSGKGSFKGIFGGSSKGFAVPFKGSSGGETTASSLERPAPGSSPQAVGTSVFYRQLQPEPKTP